jgi:hypothetical protein
MRAPTFDRDKTIADVIKSQRRPSTLPETGWHKIGVSQELGVAFQNSWTNAVGVTFPVDAAFHQSEHGEVRFRGKVKGGAVGTTIFTLPEESRIEYTDTFIVGIEDDAGNTGVGMVLVTDTGEVKYMGEIGVSG